MATRREFLSCLLGCSAYLLYPGLLSFASERKCLVFGLIPAEDPKAMIQQYTPMAKWLEKQIGRCIELFTATDYTGVIEAMKGKKVDVAWFGAFSYVIARERANAEAFAVGVDSKGNHTYRSIIIATPEVAKALGIDRPLEGEEGMKVLKEKLQPHRKKFTFVFIDPASTSGYAAPRYYMHRAGLDPRAVFKSVGFIGTHDAGQLAVARKVVDMSADSDTVYYKLLEEGKISKDTNTIIWQSPPLPGPPLAYRKDLPEDIKRTLRENIVKVPKDVIAGWGRPVAYRLVSDKDFEVIVDMKKVIDEIKAKGGV